MTVALGIDQRTAVTPFRSTRVELDGPEWVLNRQVWRITRSADHIQRATDPRLGASSNVTLLPGYAWTLRPGQADMAEALKSVYASSFLGLSDVNYAPGMIRQYTAWKSPADIPGVTVDPIYSLEGIPVFRKTVPAGVGADAVHLAEDAAALPIPPLPTQMVPMSRVIAGRTTNRANQGWLIYFLVPPVSLAPPDNIISFYFGGPADTVQPRTNGGAWCITFRGDGRAILWELGWNPEFTWSQRMEFRYSHPTRVASGWTWCRIIPHRNNRILIETTHAEGDPQGKGLAGQLEIALRREPITYTIYKHLGGLTGHTFRRYIAGPGEIRADARTDLRFNLGIARFSFPGVGNLVDLPWVVPYRMPGGTVMTLIPDADVPDGCDLTSTIYDGDTHGPLTQDSDGNFLSNINQSVYYVQFSFTSDGTDTPVLLGYEVRVEGYREELALPTISAELATDIKIFGTDNDPTHAGAQVKLYDRKGQLARLDQRARGPVKLIVHDSQVGDDVVVYHGEVARAVKTQITARDGHPLTTYDCEFNGQWARLFEQIVVTRETRGKDPTAPLDPATGEAPNYKITGLIKEYFEKAGVHPSQVDCPDLNLRLWPTSDARGDIYLLEPGKSFGAIIDHLTRVYLDHFLTFDENTGPLDDNGIPRGMWRVLANPVDPSSNVLWSFIDGPAGVGPQLVHSPGSYNPRETFIQRGTLATYVQAPEANLVLVVGFGDTLPGSSAAHVYNAAMWNPRSYNRDPSNPTADSTHVDYLGREIREQFMFAGATSQKAANFLCRRIFDLIAYGRKWSTLSAPLVFMNDPKDTQLTGRRRHLRYGDGVYINGTLGVVRSCNPYWSVNEGGDRVQMGHYEVVHNFGGDQFPVPGRPD